MTEPQQDGNERGGIKFLGTLLPFLPKLLLSLSITYLQFKRRAKKAGKVFQKELIKQGIDKHTAVELTEFYMTSSRFRTIRDISMKNFSIFF
jgi:hypothetical protein